MSEANLQQMARHLKCSTRTLAGLIEEHANFPIIERGDQGKPWRFDPKAVAKFLKADEARRRAAEVKRQADLAKHRPMFTPRSTGTPDEQLKVLRIRIMEREEAEMMAKLVRSDEISDLMVRAFRLLGQSHRHFADNFAMRHNLPEALKRALGQSLNELMHDFKRNCGKFLDEEQAKSAPVPEPGDSK